MSGLPIYEVIRRDLLSQIRDGVLRTGDRLPSEPELAAQFGVSRMTVRQAIDQLVIDHVVVRRRGSGTYVTSAPRYRRLNRLAPFRDEIGVGDADVRTEIRERRELVAPPDVAERLLLKEGQKVVRLVRLRTVDGEPAALQESWVPYALAPNLAREDLVEGSLYRTLSERWGVAVKWAEQQISAAAATEEQASLLGVPMGGPLMTIVRLTFSGAESPVELAHSWTRPEYPLLTRLDA
ncbi:GntR family transcriptional regulator [Actinoallomurus acaciae]|uniref:GntR family transcriptional regulator n=1 Tax=Actinoallomurus acaciae TaxID=502577 RepID=A0ABV5YPF1_9ACTN